MKKKKSKELKKRIVGDQAISHFHCTQIQQI